MHKVAIFHKTSNVSEPLFGRRLESGDTLEAGDRYDSTTGVWSPPPFVGATLGPGSDAVWIRPAAS